MPVQLLGQSVVSFDRGRDAIISIVEDEEGVKRAYGQELEGGARHSVLIDPQDSSCTEIYQRLRFDDRENFVLSPRPGRLSKEDVRRSVEESGSILVRCVTWNLQGRPTAEASELRRRLLPFEDYHVLHVGTQECERSIAASLLIQSKAKWTALLREAVGPNYEPIVSHTLQATHSILFVHRGILPLLRGIRSAAVATGIGTGETRLGNKGGVGLALRLGKARLLFVTAHLAAHEKNAEVRHREVTKISTELCRSLQDNPVTRAVETSKEEVDAPLVTGQTSLLDTFDCVFWSGDLNYRVELSRENADAALDSGDLSPLQEADQLRRAMNLGLVFSGFQEGTLTFRPTYKFDSPGEGNDTIDVYDSSAKQRVPSWTDRILWSCPQKTSRSCSAALIDYTSIPELRSSDHRPVCATFDVNFIRNEKEEKPQPGADKSDEYLHQSQVCSIQ